MAAFYTYSKNKSSGLNAVDYQDMVHSIRQELMRNLKLILVLVAGLQLAPMTTRRN